MATAAGEARKTAATSSIARSAPPLATLRWQRAMRASRGLSGSRRARSVRNGDPSVRPAPLPCASPPMDPTPAPLLSTPLQRPARGGSTRVRCGRSELVLEAARGGHSLLWLDGRQARRFAIGLDPTGQLSFALRAPHGPLRVVPRDVIALVPGGRLHGYVQLPLVPTILWHPRQGPARALLELAPRELAAEWDDREGAVFRCTSPLHVRFPMRSGEPMVTVPVWIDNPTQAVASPPWLPLVIETADLLEARGTILVKPRRLRWNGEILAGVEARRRFEVAP